MPNQPYTSNMSSASKQTGGRKSFDASFGHSPGSKQYVL